MDRRIHNLVGRHFGRLTVEAYAGPMMKNQAVWLCRCTCGRTVNVTAGNLRKLDTPNTRSCGCLRRELARVVGLENRRCVWLA